MGWTPPIFIQAASALTVLFCLLAPGFSHAQGFLGNNPKYFMGTHRCLDPALPDLMECRLEGLEVIKIGLTQSGVLSALNVKTNKIDLSLTCSGANCGALLEGCLHLAHSAQQFKTPFNVTFKFQDQAVEEDWFKKLDSFPHASVDVSEAYLYSISCHQ